MMMNMNAAAMGGGFGAAMPAGLGANPLARGAVNPAMAGMQGMNPAMAGVGTNPMASAGMGAGASSSLGLPPQAFTGDGVGALLTQVEQLVQSTMAMFGGMDLNQVATNLGMQKQAKQQSALGGLGQGDTSGIESLLGGAGGMNLTA